MKELFEFVRSFPAWLRRGRSDLEHAHRRRLTPVYRVKKRKLKTLWLIAGVLMLFYPDSTFIVIVVLIATLLSFAVLDESS
jgi:hypothetical protein